MISGKKVSLTLRGNSVLKEVSFELPNGRITSFIGGSGAGKSSILRTVALLEQSFSGTITLNGIQIRSMSKQDRAHSIGFLLQTFELFPHMTVFQNCSHPLRTVLGLDKKIACERVELMLNHLGILSMKDKYPSTLSGGEKQRASLARMLVMEPKVVMLDEPTSALDPENREAVVKILKDLAGSGIAVGVASHDSLFLCEILDKIYFVENGMITETFDSLTEQIGGKQKISRFLSGAIEKRLDQRM